MGLETHCTTTAQLNYYFYRNSCSNLFSDFKSAHLLSEVQVLSRDWSSASCDHHESGAVSADEQKDQLTHSRAFSPSLPPPVSTVLNMHTWKHTWNLHVGILNTLKDISTSPWIPYNLEENHLKNLHTVTLQTMAYTWLVPSLLRLLYHPILPLALQCSYTKHPPVNTPTFPCVQGQDILGWAIFPLCQ